MPFKSKAQQRAMYAKAAKGEIDQSVVDEFSEATKKKKGGFKSLPDKVKKQEKKAGLELDIEIGDTILTGRFKNSPKVVKSFGTDSKGQPTVNGMKLLACRIEKLMPKSMQKSASMPILRMLKSAAESNA